MELTHELKVIDNFVASYLATAEWVTVDGRTRGFTKASKQIARKDCLEFMKMIVENFTAGEVVAILSYQGSDLSSLAGHDFFLTRNRHGAGFWDKDIYNELAENGCDKLTELAMLCGTADAFQYKGYLYF
jgi:hypothetical protein